MTKVPGPRKNVEDALADGWGIPRGEELDRIMAYVDAYADARAKAAKLEVLEGPLWENWTESNNRFIQNLRDALRECIERGE